MATAKSSSAVLVAEVTMVVLLLLVLVTVSLATPPDAKQPACHGHGCQRQTIHLISNPNLGKTTTTLDDDDADEVMVVARKGCFGLLHKLDHGAAPQKTGVYGAPL